jgi:hypothetical protein
MNKQFNTAFIKLRLIESQQTRLTDRVGVGVMESTSFKDLIASRIDSTSEGTMMMSLRLYMLFHLRWCDRYMRDTHHCHNVKEIGCSSTTERQCIGLEFLRPILETDPNFDSH